MIENLFSMAGKVCVVTGGSSGLGSYMAQGFLEAGAVRVYVTARSEDKLKDKASELSAIADGECIPLPGDLSSLDGIESLSADLHEKEDHIDVLVNNAGVGTGGPFSDMTPEAWDMTMDLNLRSPVFLTPGPARPSESQGYQRGPIASDLHQLRGRKRGIRSCDGLLNEQECNRAHDASAGSGIMRRSHSGQHHCAGAFLLRNDQGRLAGSGIRSIQGRTAAYSDTSLRRVRGHGRRGSDVVQSSRIVFYR